MKTRILVFLIVLITAFGYSASAASSYNSYVYDNNGEAYAAPDAFYYKSQIDLKSLKDDKGNEVGMQYPNDVFVADDGLIYVSGDGEDENENKVGMVLVLNPDFSFNKVIKNFKHSITLENGKTKNIKDSFGSVTNAFIDKNDGSIYVCDVDGATVDNNDYDVAKNLPSDGTPAGRVIKFNKNLEVEMIISGIKSEILPNDFVFQPSKIVVDNYGRIFVLSKGFTMGIMEIDAYGDFVQCIGAPAVTYNPIELIWRAINTDEQNEAAEDFVPTEYSGIDIDDDGFIFVTNKTFDETTYEEIVCLSRLNARGNDVLRVPSETSNPFGDVDASWKTQHAGPSKLTDVLTLDYGVYAVLDELRGKVFFYNADGVNLFEFGTVADDPDTDHVTFIEGNLDAPVAVEWLDNADDDYEENDETKYGGRCLVLDYNMHCINLYETTEYANKIFHASYLNNQNKFEEEEEIWKEVLKLNGNSVAAKQNIAKVYYRDGDWKTAMKYFKEIKDTENYSKAYKYQRREYINQYFEIAILVIVVLIIMFMIYKKWRKTHPKKVNEDSLWSKIKFSKNIMFRPLHGSWILTRENKGSVGAATIILLAVSTMSLLQARFTGFIFSPEAEDVNILAEFAKICLPVLLFVVCNWCVTSLMAGEGSLKAIYMSACYSLVPIIYLYPVAIILSNVMVLEEGDFYTVFVTIALVFVFALIFLGNMRIHDYSPGMALLEIVITVVVMLLVVFLAILFFALIQQMYTFVEEIIEELATR